MEIRISLLEIFELLAKDNVRLGPGTEDEVDVAGPAAIREIPDLRHQRSNSDAARDQDETVGIGAGKREPSSRGGDIQHVSLADVVVQLSRGRPVCFPFDGDLAESAARGGRCDRVRTIDLPAVNHHREVQVLAGKIVERQVRTDARYKAKRADFRGFDEDAGNL